MSGTWWKRSNQTARPQRGGVSYPVSEHDSVLNATFALSCWSGPSGRLPSNRKNALFRRLGRRRRAPGGHRLADRNLQAPRQSSRTTISPMLLPASLTVIPRSASTTSCRGLTPPCPNSRPWPENDAYCPGEYLARAPVAPIALRSSAPGNGPAASRSGAKLPRAGTVTRPRSRAGSFEGSRQVRVRAGSRLPRSTAAASVQKRESQRTDVRQELAGADGRFRHQS
jgi:hypothetical protein